MIRLNCDDWAPVVSKLKDKIRDWYVSSYPTDYLGSMIPDKLSFWDAVCALNIGVDIYCLLGDAADSVVRGRVFGKIAEIIGCDYDTVYNTWLGG